MIVGFGDKAGEDRNQQGMKSVFVIDLLESYSQAIKVFCAKFLNSQVKVVTHPMQEGSGDDWSSGKAICSYPVHPVCAA